MNLLNNVVGKLTGNFGSGGHLMVQCIEGRNLARKDLLSKSDPYCVFSVVHKHSLSILSNTQRTTTITNNQNPIWNQLFTFNVNNSDTELLKIKVYDHDSLSFDDLIGEVDIPLFALCNGVPKDDWYQLFPANGGSLHLILTAQGFGMMGAPGMQAGSYGVPQAGGPPPMMPNPGYTPPGGYGAPAYGFAARLGYPPPAYPQPGHRGY